MEEISAEAHDLLSGVRYGPGRRVAARSPDLGRPVGRPQHVAGLQDRFRVIVPDRSGTATVISHTTRTPTATPDIAADVLAVPDREAPRLR